MEKLESNCRFYQVCGPSAINNFYLKDRQEGGGDEFRQKYCFGDPEKCSFFQIRLARMIKKLK